MRTIVCADFHFNINNRLLDFKDSANQIADYAIKKKADVVHFLGDAFHRRRPHPLEQRAFEKWVMKLTSNNIQVEMITGNHDETTDTNTIEYFNILNTKNVKVAKPPMMCKGIYYDHMLLKESEMGPLSYRKPVSGLSVNGLISKHPKIKAFILGHIHKPQVISKKPLVMHIGSIERVNFGERNEDKYFLDINNGKLKMIKLNIRPMIQYDVDLRDPETLEQVSTIPTEYDRKPIVKIVLFGTKQQIDKALPIVEEYRKECYSLKVIKKLKRNKSRSQKTKISEEKTTSQNFIEYAKLKKLSEKVVTEGTRLINELTEATGN